MTILTFIEKVGLTEGERKVYLALLEIGQSAITKIIKRSNVSTSKSYDILHRLEEKGLVSHVIIQGAKYFKATNPERLKEILEEKRTDIEATILEMDKIIPTLISKQRLNESEEEAEILVGIKGLISIFNEETNWMKKTNTASYVIGATKGGLSGAKIEAFFKRMQDKRNYLKLRTKFIFNENMRGKFPYLERSNCCEIKYVNTGSEMTSISIFGNKVVIAVYSRRPFLFVIKSKYVAEDFKKYFEVLWKTAKE